MKNYLILLLLPFALSSCKKDKPVKETSTPVKFITTDYSYLGTYDDQGKPNLVEKDVVSTELVNYVNTSLPEKGDISKTHPEFLKNADLAISAKSDVYITFTSEGTGFANSVGYYLYKTGSSPVKPADIEKITYIFPNASSNKGGTLRPGDKVKLGTIESGMSIGFVLLEKGWDSVTKTVNKDAPHYCSNKALNPEDNDLLKPHTVLFDYPAEHKVIIGFEDTNRTLASCDHDFNDVVIYATVVAK
ncbi:MAG: hypothetical protein JWN56_2778 [Sphingobacteriales bacterium]|nr:hypothetical protein [Sphingobacteriales bacterium]